jgi:hypothetical protein
VSAGWHPASVSKTKSAQALLQSGHCFDLGFICF